MGCPIFSYETASIGQEANPANMDEVWSMMLAADTAHYPMGAGTTGTSDRDTNDCGIAQRHAYSIMAVFEMTDGANNHRMIMLRNPWGATYYTDDWSYTDSRWTNELVAQVPFGLDPRTSPSIGVYTMPIETFTDSSIDCIYDY
jgi:hypothetical protein